MESLFKRAARADEKFIREALESIPSEKRRIAIGKLDALLPCRELTEIN
ncbi:MULTISPECIES: hypothetical protein [unclassified Sporolactobacillus]|nr:hypothetical protein [Sporolactobacillus sp. CQH2019]MDD9150744.1 hypothetical protein [Sporolactobacillus sp. CQH2019]